jgi:sulfatase maturation enzyme AslB (radical SAM superfamily)
MSSLAAIDDETHLSCSYLDSGLSFGFFQVYACGIVHDGIHPPVLIDNFKGGPIPWDTVQAARTEIIRQNQNGGHPNCRGCVHLTRRKKSPGSSRVDWLGLQHWQGCNLDCHYCSLNTRRSAPVRPPPGMPLAHYKVGETLESLIAEKRLDANAVIDWGGGGEPLLMPEFNSAFRLLARLGADQWLHTNGTVFPICLKKDASNLSRVHVICSLDSGTRPL